jgi:hypothetical protein
MATAAPHVKLLRQLSDARDDYRSGALDVDWDGGRATLFMVFGQPSHAVFEEKGKGKVEGNAALAALLRDLPPLFSVEPWRRAMTPSETLHCTVDDLVHHFAELAAAHAPGPDDPDGRPSLRFAAGDDSPDLPYDLTTFPMLPDGETLAPETPAKGTDVTELAGRLVSGLITLTGPRLRAAATVNAGEIVDAVWVDSESHAVGETAAMALMGADEGSLAAYRFTPEVAEALGMLWRLPVEQKSMNLKWLNPDALMDSFTRGGEDRVVSVDAQTRAVGLFVNGNLVAAYSSEQRRPVSDPRAFRELLAQPEGRITVLRRSNPNGSRRPAGAATLAASASPRVEDQEPVPPEWFSPPQAETPDTAGDLDVDFAEVRRELAQIVVAWLGERDGRPVMTLIQATRSTVDDFVTTIDTIRATALPGYDPSLIQSLARELQMCAAERLCAA